MRMWMVPVKLMCRKHLLGEHVEHHMIVASLQRKISIKGFVDNNCIEVSSIIDRHQSIASEMTRRGYNHNSDLIAFSIDHLPIEHRDAKVDVDKSLNDLKKRCPECKGRFNDVGL